MVWIGTPIETSSTQCSTDTDTAGNMDMGHYNSKIREINMAGDTAKKQKIIIIIGLYVACPMRIFYFNFCGVIEEENMHLFQAQKS